MTRGLGAFDETALAMWGSVLATAIKRAKITRRTLAKRMRVSPPYISAVLSGDNLTLTQASRLLWACGFEIRFSAIDRPGRARKNTDHAKRGRPWTGVSCPECGARRYVQCWRHIPRDQDYHLTQPHRLRVAKAFVAAKARR